MTTREPCMTDRVRTSTPHGFTLVELIVTIAILGIVVSMAIPAFESTLLGSKLASFANDLASSAQLARSEAIKRNSPITLCVSSNGSACGTGSWEQGWIIRTSDNGVLFRHSALPTGLKMAESGGQETVVFRPTGVGSTAASFIVCRATPSPGPQERTVTISATGRTSVGKSKNGSCP